MTRYAYDEVGNQTNQVDALGRVTRYEYDAHSGVTSYAYDGVGNLQSFTYANGVYQAYAYDALNRLTNLVAAKSLTNLASYAYALGPTGNRLSVTELSGRTASYAYDNLYRLRTETVANDPGSLNGTVGYTLDAVGNRSGRSVTGALVNVLPSQTFTYNSNDWLNVGIDHSYDANGNTTIGVSGRREGVAGVYDFENRLVYQTNGLQGVLLTYDGDGNRVRKEVSDRTNTVTTYFLVDSRNLTGYAQVLEEFTSTNGAAISLNRVYGYGHDPISQYQCTPYGWQLSYYGYDGHGSVRFLTDATGQVTDRYQYDAFGNLIALTGSTPNLYLYTGEQYDPDLGFYYLRARYANPDSGRFWTMDSYEGSGGDPLSLHKYLYAHGNPVNGWDPSGHMTLGEIFSVQSFMKLGFAAQAGVVATALDRASVAVDVVTFFSTMLATGTVNPIALAELSSNFIPFAKAFKGLKAVGRRIHGAADALRDLYKTSKNPQLVGEIGAGLAAKAHKMKPIGFNPRYHGIDDVFEDAAGNLVVIEAKGGSAALGATMQGQQMSRQWIEAKILKLKSGTPGEQEIADRLRAAIDSTPPKLRGMVVKTRVDGADAFVPDAELKDWSQIGFNAW